jgi:hypothetical protein
MSSETFVEEEFKNPFVEEEFLGPADTDTSRAAYLGEKPEVGDAFKAIDKDNYEVKLNANERIAAEVPNLKEENELLKIKLGKALGKVTPGGKKDLINIDTSSLGSFASSIGNSFMNIAKEVPKRIDEISKDPEKKRNFMRGLEIIEASSGIKPISQAKSPLGAISEGLLKAEKGFIATDLAKAKNETARLKASKSGRNVLDPQEAALLKGYTGYIEKEDEQKKNYAATFDIYGLLKKASLENKSLPTGALNKIFQGAEQIISEIKGGDALLKKLYENNGDMNAMEPKERITFKNMLGAATKQKIVSQVKELYPVSNKDIEILLQTVGDIGTDPEALRRLVSTQMAAREIALKQRNYATEAFKKNDLDFKETSFYAAEKELANSFRKDIKPETLQALFGTTKDVTDSGIIAAHYYQNLQPQFDNNKNPFDIFQENKAKTEADIKKIIEDRQKVK